MARDCFVSGRATGEERRLVEAAADALGVTLSRFTREATVSTARQVARRTSARDRADATDARLRAALEEIEGDQTRSTETQRK